MVRTFSKYGPNIAPISSQQLYITCADLFEMQAFSAKTGENLSHFRHLEAKILLKQPKQGPYMAKMRPLYGPNNLTFNGILLFGLHDSPVKILAISGIQKPIYCRNSQNMALIWSKHGPNMVLLMGHNIGMSIGPISLSPESFISLVCLESQLQVRLVNYPLTDT